MTNQPLRSILSKPDVTGRLIKWDVELGEFDIEYRGRTSIKGQILTDFVIEMVKEDTTLEETEAASMMHVDGSAGAHKGGCGIFIKGPREEELEYTVKLNFEVTNNEAEYEAAVQGLEIVYNLGIRNLIVYTDSGNTSRRFVRGEGGQNERLFQTSSHFNEEIRPMQIAPNTKGGKS